MSSLWQKLVSSGSAKCVYRSLLFPILNIDLDIPPVSPTLCYVISNLCMTPAVDGIKFLKLFHMSNLRPLVARSSWPLLGAMSWYATSVEHPTAPKKSKSWLVARSLDKWSKEACSYKDYEKWHSRILHEVVDSPREGDVDSPAAGSAVVAHLGTSRHVCRTGQALRRHCPLQTTFHYFWCS